MLFKSFNKVSYIRLLGLLLATAAVVGCSIGSPGADVAQKAADGFYQAMEKNDLDKALTYYSDKRSKEEWRGRLEHLRDTLGTVQSFKLKHTEVNTVFSGRIYIFDYQVNYSSGKGAKETLTLFDSVDSDDTPLIVSHTIAAEGVPPSF